MRIGIDVRALQEHSRFRGIGVCLANLISALVQIDKHNHYCFFLWSGGSPLEAIVPPRFSYASIKLPPTFHTILREVKNRFIRDIKISKSDLDVFLQPNVAYGLPCGKVPTVTIVYDLIPLIFKKHHPRISTTSLFRHGIKRGVGRILRAWLDPWHFHQIVKSDRIIAISGATERDLLRYFPRLDPGKLSVVHLASDPAFRPSPNPQALRRFGIRRPYLLYVGGADSRKNVAAFLRAYDLIRECGYGVQLVLVGKEFESRNAPAFPEIWDLMESLKHQSDVICTGFIGTDDLRALYSSALVFVFPSLYEGFGLPVLEAMACGCPVVAYRTAAIPEVAGTAALLLEPSTELTDAIIRVISDEKLRKSMITEGLRQSQRFSWERMARETLRVLEDAVGAR